MSEPRHRRRARVSLWLAFAFCLLLIGWWELVQRPAPQPQALPAQASALPNGLESAVFAGGCFWCTEADFDKVPGVVATISGYTGGTTANPNYAEVSSQATGHAEAVRVIYDPARVRYAQLLEHFWRSIDPTTRNRQFCDIGTPYRSAIFVADEQQRQAALASLAALQASKPFAEPIVTTIEPLGDFYPAEEEHQDYAQKNPLRYSFYRASCGRDARLQALWGPAK
ncbi:MAG: peptide-methionine (S)-S-oxide reductase MsrA [Rhodoferax sp.]